MSRNACIFNQIIFSVNFDIGENDRVLNIEQTDDDGYIVLLSNESPLVNHKRRFFIKKGYRNILQNSIQLLILITLKYANQ